MWKRRILAVASRFNIDPTWQPGTNLTCSAELDILACYKYTEREAWLGAMLLLPPSSVQGFSHPLLAQESYLKALARCKSIILCLSSLFAIFCRHNLGGQGLIPCCCWCSGPSPDPKRLGGADLLQRSTITLISYPQVMEMAMLVSHERGTECCRPDPRRLMQYFEHHVCRMIMMQGRVRLTARKLSLTPMD